jgi:hypothetical protein
VDPGQWEGLPLSWPLAAIVAGPWVLLADGGTSAAAVRGAAAAGRIHWGRAEPVPGLTALNAGYKAQLTALSCWAAGDCAAGGFYTDGRRRRQHRTWANAQGSDFSDGNALTCVRPDGCVLGGDVITNTQRAEVASESAGTWGRPAGSARSRARPASSCASPAASTGVPRAAGERSWSVRADDGQGELAGTALAHTVSATA